MQALVLWKAILEISFIWILIYFMIRFVQGTRAFLHDAVHRNLLSGSHAQA